jgi:hypothetical protein
MPSPQSQAEAKVRFSPFHAVLEAGVDRLLEFMGRDPFTFVANGKAFASTVPEAIAISPAVSAALRANPLQRSFSISSESIESEDFRISVQFHSFRSAILWAMKYFRLDCFPR